MEKTIKQLAKEKIAEELVRYKVDTVMRLLKEKEYLQNRIDGIIREIAKVEEMTSIAEKVEGIGGTVYHDYNNN